MCFILKKFNKVRPDFVAGFVGNAKSCCLGCAHVDLSYKFKDIRPLIYRNHSG